VGSIRTQSISGTIALYMGQGLGLLNKIVLFPLVFAGEEEFWGLLTLMLGLSAVLGGLSTFGFNKVIQRFIPPHPESETRVVRIALTGSGIGGILVLAAAWWAGPALARFSSAPELFVDFGGLLLALMLGQWFFELGSALFAARYKAQYGLFANNVTVRVLQSILLIWCYLGGIDVRTFLWLNGVVYAVNHFVLFILAVQSIPKSSSVEPIASVSGMANYAGFMVVLGIVSQAFLQLDGILVGHFLVLSQLAFLDLAKNLGSVLDLPTRALASSSLSTLSRLMKQRDYLKVGQIYSNASFVQLFLGMLMLVLVLNHIDVLIVSLPTSGYEVLKPLFIVVALGKLVDLATGLNWAIITNSDSYRYNLWIGLVTLSAMVALEWWMIPEYGLLGAAWGMAFAYVLNNTLRLVLVWRQFGLLPWNANHRKLAPLIAVAIFSAIPLPLSLVWSVVLKDLVLFGILVWYIQPGRTIPQWDDLMDTLRAKWAR
jgi:O-antigen/teichoic acid export membrane protein